MPEQPRSERKTRNRIIATGMDDYRVPIGQERSLAEYPDVRSDVFAARASPKTHC